ncbi:hypothetical protein [uncultured Nostoc sp.]|uniref:hypothetical protein n=1 Tax=uncultured Nostoc sp. TaxID=340711 RepID=UPI0035CAFFA0
MSKFVISVNDSEDKLEGYYSSTTNSDGLLTEDLNEANVFLTKTEARTIAGRYQSLNADKDVAVVAVTVVIKPA